MHPTKTLTKQLNRGWGACESEQKCTRNKEENEIKTRTDKVHNFGHVFRLVWEPFGEILGSKSGAKIIGKKHLKLRAPQGNPKGPSRPENMVGGG